jgi:hypothetical protein
MDETLVKESIKEFHPKEALQSVEMKDLSGIQRDAVALKFLEKELTAQQLAELIQIPPPQK